MRAMAHMLKAGVPMLETLQRRGIGTCAVRSLNRKWREDRKLPENPTSYGPLTNLPDYSFSDGRPVPYGTNQKRRIDEQKSKLSTIKKLVGEIDQAVVKHERKLIAAKQEKQRILNSKLKAKGDKLLLNEKKDGDPSR